MTQSAFDIERIVLSRGEQIPSELHSVTFDDFEGRWLLAHLHQLDGDVPYRLRRRIRQQFEPCGCGAMAFQCTRCHGLGVVFPSLEAAAAQELSSRRALRVLDVAGDLS